MNVKKCAMGMILAVWTATLMAQTAPPAPVTESPQEQARLDAVWNQLYDRPQQLAALKKPAVCLLDIQHPEVIRGQLAKMAKPLEEARQAKLRARLAELSGLDSLVIHQSEVTGSDLERPMIKAILIGGRSKTASRAKDEEFFPLIRTTKTPVIGLCGGCQLIGSAYKAKVSSLRKLRPGETDPNPKYHPGLFKEWGFLPVKIVKRDPLFAGLPDEIVVREMHAYQITEVPPEFELLASSDECRVQAIRHKDRLLYGTQFHPEAYDDEHLDGQKVLKNFFRLALGR